MYNVMLTIKTYHSFLQLWVYLRIFHFRFNWNTRDRITIKIADSNPWLSNSSNLHSYLFSLGKPQNYDILSITINNKIGFMKYLCDNVAVLQHTIAFGSSVIIWCASHVFECTGDFKLYFLFSIHFSKESSNFECQ